MLYDGCSGRFMAKKSRKAARNARIEPTFGDSPVETRRAPAKRTRKKAKGSVFWRLTKWVFSKVPRMTYWGSVAALWGFIAVLCVFGWHGAKLPNASSWELPDRPANVRIVGMDDKLLLNRGAGGTALRLEDMSPYLPQAVIAIEDHRFQSHFGFDPIGFTRAMVRNVMSGRMREGGSTLTQQLAKNLFLKPERTIDRKIQELILAFWLEANYSKAEILELYLNRVYFGAGAWGVDAAARRYFGKPASALSLDESAMIAGLLKAPSRLSPARNPKLARERSRLVIAAMKREGFIKPNAVDPEGEPVITTSYYRSGAEHFVADMVMKEVKNLIGDVAGDITVQTTISPYLMTAAQDVLQASLSRHGKKRDIGQGALVSMMPDGAVRALIGGRDYSKSQYNRAVDAKRQPGSAFKTFVWMAALERGYQPNTVMLDEPVRLGKWRPENYDRRFRGDVTLSEAFSQSLNTIAAKLTVAAGPNQVAGLARDMGVKSKLTRNASIALGTSEVSLLELTSAYAPLANGGLRAEPYFVTKITGKDGKILYKRGKRPRTRVISPGIIGPMNGMLHRAVREGTGKNANLKNHFVAGKTGTSQNSRDAWFVGHSAHLVTGIWFGNDDNSPMKKVTGGSVPALAWRDYMGAAHAGLDAKLLPGDQFLAVAMPDKLPLPSFRPRQPGEPSIANGRIADFAERGKTRFAQVRDGAKKTILDILFGQ